MVDDGGSLGFVSNVERKGVDDVIKSMSSFKFGWVMPVINLGDVKLLVKEDWRVWSLPLARL